MSCKFSDFSGKCTQFDADFLLDNMGYDKDGNCMVEDDENPLNSCEDFEER
jgi:hypothetical protein